MATESDTGLIKEYDTRCKLYGEFTDKVEGLIRELLDENGVRVLTITSRIKDRGSLERKLSQADGKYSTLEGVTDISGVRIITYFASEVDYIAQMIESEFDIDRDNSVDKRKALDPDRFGYLSLHYVARLAKDRLKLTEYRKYEGCVVEIQIRSILQHAWAEIEHDLGYKSKQALPRDTRRDFARLAGLLEIADERFDMIRDRLAEYEANVPKQIEEAPDAVLLDHASLKSFIDTDSLVRSLDEEIAGALNLKTEMMDIAIDDYLRRFAHLGLASIGDLRRNLQAREGQVLPFSIAFYPRMKAKVTVSVSAGISLHALCYLLAITKGGREQLIDFLNALTQDKSRVEGLAQKLLDAYEGMKSP